MSTTPNRKVTNIAEGVTDIEAAVNNALREIDAKFVPIVLEMDVEELPASASDGELYVMATTVSGYNGYLAQWVGDGGFWQYTPPEQVGVVLNRQDGGMYAWNFQTPGAWAPATVTSGSTLEADAAAARQLTAQDAGKYIRYTHASPVVTMDDAENYVIGSEFHGRYQGAGALSIEGSSGFVINPPYQGSLDIPPGGTFTIKVVGTHEADLIGLTIAGS